MTMAEPFGTLPEAGEAPADDSMEPIFIRKLDRLETTNRSNPNGA
jgi:hypothetical protein